MRENKWLANSKNCLTGSKTRSNRGPLKSSSKFWEKSMTDQTTVPIQKMVEIPFTQGLLLESALTLTKSQSMKETPSTMVGIIKTAPSLTRMKRLWEQPKSRIMKPHTLIQSEEKPSIPKPSSNTSFQAISMCLLKVTNSWLQLLVSWTNLVVNSQILDFQTGILLSIKIEIR